MWRKAVNRSIDADCFRLETAIWLLTTGLVNLHASRKLATWTINIVLHNTYSLNSSTAA